MKMFAAKLFLQRPNFFLLDWPKCMFGPLDLTTMTVSNLSKSKWGVNRVSADENTRDSRRQCSWIQWGWHRGLPRLLSIPLCGSYNTLNKIFGVNLWRQLVRFFFKDNSNILQVTATTFPFSFYIINTIKLGTNNESIRFINYLIGVKICWKENILLGLQNKFCYYSRHSRAQRANKSFYIKTSF